MPHFIVNNLRQANLSCNCSSDWGKCKALLPCRSRFNTISAVCAKTWCDESNLCLLSQGDVEGVTWWLTSLKILLDKNLIGPTGEGKRKAFSFLFISWLLAFDSDLCLCASGIILLCKVWNGNLWILSGALTYWSACLLILCTFSSRSETEEIGSECVSRVVHRRFGY